MLGESRTFELLEFLFIFFALTSGLTLLVVVLNSWRAHRKIRHANTRLEELVTYLGRNLFGDDGWNVVERTASHNGQRLESLLRLFERDAFEMWAQRVVKDGVATSDEIEQMRYRMVQDPEIQGIASIQQDVSEIIPTSGMPIAIGQGSLETRGTIAEVASDSFTVWLLDGGSQLSEDDPVTCTILSRSGPYRFESRIRHDDEDTLNVRRPARLVKNQKRRFRRHTAELPAAVRGYLSENSPQRVMINELSGGGATITNPESRFSLGSVLEISFSAGQRRYSVAGRVVRVSENAKLLHLRFEAMKDQQREQLAHSVAIS